MKKWIKKTITWLLVFLVLFLTSAGTFIRYYGKDLIIAGLEFVFESPVILESISYEFPFGVKGQKLSIQKKFQASQIVVQFNPLLLIFGKVELRRIIFKDPVVFLGKNSLNVVGLSDSGSEIKNGSRSKKSEESSMLPSIRIDHMVFENASFSYPLPFKGKGLWFRGEAIDVMIENLNLPDADEKSQFSFTGKGNFIDKQGISIKGQIGGDGWFDLSKYNMVSRFKFRSDDFKTTLTALCESDNDNMMVSGSILTDKIILPISENKSGALMEGVLGHSMAVELKYKFPTSMSHFRVDGDIPYEGSFIMGSSAQK